MIHCLCRLGDCDWSRSINKEVNANNQCKLFIQLLQNFSRGGS